MTIITKKIDETKGNMDKMIENGQRPTQAIRDKFMGLSKAKIVCFICFHLAQ